MAAVNQRTARLAGFLAIFHAALFLDITFDWRWLLYRHLEATAIVQRWYQERHWPQVGMLVVLAALLFAGIMMARQRFPSPPGAAMALDGSLLSIGCWATEVISLHATDAILYHRIGSLMTVSFVWMLACLITTAGMLRIVNSSGHKKGSRQ